MRNIWCPDYGKCLDLAIQNDQSGFECSGCSLEFDLSGRNETDFSPYYNLLAAIFDSNFYEWGDNETA